MDDDVTTGSFLKGATLSKVTYRQRGTAHSSFCSSSRASPSPDQIIDQTDRDVLNVRLMHDPSARKGEAVQGTPGNSFPFFSLGIRSSTEPNRVSVTLALAVALASRSLLFSP